MTLRALEYYNRNTIDVHSDVKHAVITSHVCIQNSTKYNTINVSVFWMLGESWIVIPSLASRVTVHYRLTGPTFDAL